MNFHIRRRKQDVLALNLYVATGIGGHISSERKIMPLCIDLEVGIGGKSGGRDEKEERRNKGRNS